MRPAKRFLAIGIVIGAVEAALGVVLIESIVGAYFLVLAATTVAFAIGAHRLLDVGPRDDGGGGRGGPPRDDDPPPEPPWWPEFEGQFRAHVQARVRTPPRG